MGPEKRIHVELQQVQFQRLGWAGKERRVIRHEQWRRRMEFASIQCSRFRKLWRSSPVISTPLEQMYAYTIFACR
jgi:hypothetical protein